MKKKIIITILILTLAFIISVPAVYLYIDLSENKNIKPADSLNNADAVLVLGALVYSDTNVSYVVENRLKAGLEAYNAGKASKIIVSGDHGRKDYNEVEAMKNYLLDKGVKREDIFMDHAGFDTYDSIYRAKAIFCAESLIIATQETHLKRALYIANHLEIKAEGIIAVPYTNEVLYQKIREVPARCKAFLQAGVFKPYPKYLGEKIPVFSSSGTETQD